MKLFELINYIDPNCDMELRIDDEYGSESVGELRAIEPKYYETYRNYRVNSITSGAIHIIRNNVKRKKAVNTVGEEESV